MYKNSRGEANHKERLHEDNEETTTNLMAVIETLQAQNSKLKTDNDTKVNALTENHLQEIYELKKENSI